MFRALNDSQIIFFLTSTLFQDNLPFNKIESPCFTVVHLLRLVVVTPTEVNRRAQ